ncbi:MAG: carboxypeptidase regulatory-like domain-containing protein [Bacteroidia bacterium]
MLKKIHFTVLALLCSGMAFAQSTGSIICTVTDVDTKQALPFASVVVTRGGQQVGGGQTDLDGNVEIKPLDPGTYDVHAVYASYNDFNMSGVVVVPNTPVHIAVKMVSVSKKLPVVTIVYHKPAVDPTGHVNNSIDQADIQENALKGNVMNMVGMMSGVTQTDLNQPLHAGGSRTEDNQVIVDGMKITSDQMMGAIAGGGGSNNGPGGLPQSMIGEVNTYIGGVPAKYGDATGGIIEINTVNASPKFFGTVEGVTSEGLDAFGYNDVNFVVGGPIWGKKDSTGKRNPNAYPSVNFILGGEYTYKQTEYPNFVGGYYLYPSVLQSIQQNPLTINPLGGFTENADYITGNDIYHTAGQQYNNSQAVSGNGKIDVRISNTVTITLGGSFEYANRLVAEPSYELFNPSQDPTDISTSFRGFIRLRQRFITPQTDKNGKPAIIQNAYYTLQAEYGNADNIVENTQFKNNFFDYGYVGQFTPHYAPTWSPLESGPDGPGYYQTGLADTMLSFKPGTQNPYLANYTTDVYNGLGARNITQYSTIQENNGMINGPVSLGQNIYSMFYPSGAAYTNYEEQNSNHLRFTANFSATILKNDIQLGFEYEQNIENYYDIYAPYLWQEMYNEEIGYQQKMQFQQNPYVYAGGQYPYYGYNFQYVAANQTQFDKSLRQALGLPVTSTSWIDPSSYSPSMYSLSMFSAGELLNNGSPQIVTYYGYDYKGNLGSGSPPTINDFFNAHDANGNNTYPVAPYHPIYIAGYLQDHFEFKSLRFDVGVRVDEFNANQPVLKDPYLLFPAKKVSEVENTPLASQIPSGLNGNDVVYINNQNDPTQIVGYRNGNTWYNSGGNIISDPSVLAAATTTGTIQPYLENPNLTSTTQISSDAFTTYTPVVNVMPRIAFTFPISDMAGFFAHYDILTSRPPSGTSGTTPGNFGNNNPGFGSNIFNPVQYLYMSSYVNNTGAALSNPALQPVQTTDYELGFTQALNEKRTTALTLSAFYRAPKSEIESYKFLDAYPISYVAYDNIDFGTIKGLTLAYTLSRVGDFKMRASYTLQFATGTGSGPNSGYNLANSGEPNLQIPIPLDFDQRHTFQVNLDYHFQSGADAYDGPTITTHSGKSIEILSDAGVNLNFVASSGTPYTVQGNATQLGIGISTPYSLVGSPNGSNLPWQYRADLKVDKDFPLTIKGKDKDKEGHKCDVQVYLAITNLLNTQNVMNVYHYTGSATDDGFLASAVGQQVTAAQLSPQAFIDQYKINELNPGYLSQPRTIQLGGVFNF